MRFAATMLQYFGMLFPSCNAMPCLISDQVARSEEPASPIFRATAILQQSRSLTVRLTKARRRDSGWQVVGDEVFFSLSS
jgi:hypothetical protein